MYTLRLSKLQTHTRENLIYWARRASCRVVNEEQEQAKAVVGAGASEWGAPEDTHIPLTVPGFKTWLCAEFQLHVDGRPGRLQMIAHVLGSLPPV